jgi:hypothetical protein
MGVQGGHAQCRRAHEEDVGKHPSRELDSALVLTWMFAIATGEQVHEHRRSQHAGNAYQQQQDEREAPHRAKESARLVVSLLLLDLGQYRKDRVLHGSFGQELAQDVGDREGDEESVGRSANEDGGHDLVANQAKEPTGECSPGNDACAPGDRLTFGAARGLAVRRRDHVVPTGSSGTPGAVARLLDFGGHLLALPRAPRDREFVAFRGQPSTARGRG